MAKKNIDIEFHRAGRMSDQEFLLAMACDESAPLWKGMRELLDRAEDEIWERNSSMDLTREQRADIGIAAAVMRRIRYEMESARAGGIEMLKK